MAIYQHLCWSKLCKACLLPWQLAPNRLGMIKNFIRRMMCMNLRDFPTFHLLSECTVRNFACAGHQRTQKGCLRLVWMFQQAVSNRCWKHVSHDLEPMLCSGSWLVRYLLRVAYIGFVLDLYETENECLPREDCCLNSYKKHTKQYKNIKQQKTTKNNYKQIEKTTLKNYKTTSKIL